MNVRAKHRNWLGISWALVAAVIVGCQGAQSTTNEEFLRKPMVQRRTAILQYPAEQQIDLYLMAMLRKHPPDLALADAVASNGSTIVPALCERLVSDHRDIAKMYLVDIFLRMDQLGYYTVAEDTKTIALLQQQVSSMKDPQWKQMSSHKLERIRAGK